jgi:amidase
MTNKFGRFVLGSKVDHSVLEPFTVGLMNTFSKNKLMLPKSLRILKKSAQETEAKLEKDYDLIMTSVSTITTPKIGYFSPTLDYDEIAKRAAAFASFLPLFNISGSPAISLPLGTASDGMPVGVQFAAPYGQDALLLELALELEAAQPWKFIYNS